MALLYIERSRKQRELMQDKSGEVKRDVPNSIITGEKGVFSLQNEKALLKKGGDFL